LDLEPALALERALGSLVSCEAIEIEAGDLLAWFPHAWIQGLKDIDPADNSAVWGLMARCDASPAYLGLAAELGDGLSRTLARAVLRQRSSSGNAAARRQLLSLLTRPCGPDEVRTQLHAQLIEDGILAPDARVEVLVGGQIREITLSGAQQSGCDPDDSSG